MNIISCLISIYYIVPIISKIEGTAFSLSLGLIADNNTTELAEENERLQ